MKGGSGVWSVGGKVEGEVKYIYHEERRMTFPRAPAGYTDAS